MSPNAAPPRNIPEREVEERVAKLGVRFPTIHIVFAGENTAIRKSLARGHSSIQGAPQRQ